MTTKDDINKIKFLDCNPPSLPLLEIISLMKLLKKLIRQIKHTTCQ